MAALHPLAVLGIPAARLIDMAVALIFTSIARKKAR